jgi:hypothetical protein
MALLDTDTTVTFSKWREMQIINIQFSKLIIINENKCAKYIFIEMRLSRQ